VVEPGVINMWVSQEVADEGYYYAPDPASQIVSSIGGNLAENSGGVHCLKYGFTTNHVMGAEVVLPDGSVTHIGGGRAPDAPGYDLLGAFVGSEGTLGIATRITLRLCRVPEAVHTLLAGFEDSEGADGAVSGIIGEGIIPAAIEMMDRLTMEAVEEAVHPGLPDAGAVLVIELDGPEAEVEEQFGRVLEICEENEATEVRVAEDDEERALFWKARKAAFGAMGRISNDYYVQDGVIPRTELPAVLGRISELAGEYGLRVANVFHAGDGNLHPLVLYNNDTEGEAEKAEKLAGEIVFTCLEHGGSLTGEHGIGEDKKKYMPKMFTDDDMNVMQLLRCAFDPHQLANPGKIFPTPRLCGERPGPFHMHPLQKAGIVEQF
jgi:glycolate oxidase